MSKYNLGSLVIIIADILFLLALLTHKDTTICIPLYFLGTSMRIEHKINQNNSKNQKN